MKNKSYFTEKEIKALEKIRAYEEYLHVMENYSELKEASEVRAAEESLADLE
jgi:hypothetical protein